MNDSTKESSARIEPAIPASAAPSPQSELPTTRSLFVKVFPSIMLPMFLAVADQTIVATALPAIASGLGEIERASWVVVSYLIANTIAAPVYGRLGDTFGRRWMMIFALAIFMLGSVLCALSPNIEFLTAARVLQGFGGGGLMTLSQALIGETIPPRERGEYQGYLAGIAVSSSTFGPVAGGYLTQAFGWQLIFLINVPLGLIAFFLVLRLDARPGDRRRTTFDTPGLVLFIMFVSPVILALEQVQRMDARTLPIAFGLLAFGIFSLVLLIWQEQRNTAPLLPPRLFRQPSVWRSDGLAACHGAALVSLITFLPIYLRAVRGASPAETGLLLLPLTFGIGLGSLITGQLVSRTGRTAIYPTYGLAAATAGLVFLAFGLARLESRPDAVGVLLHCAVHGQRHGCGADHGADRGWTAHARYRRGHGAVLPLGGRGVRHRRGGRDLVLNSRGNGPRHRKPVRRHHRPRPRSHRDATGSTAGHRAIGNRRRVSCRIPHHCAIHHSRHLARLVHAAAPPVAGARHCGARPHAANSPNKTTKT